MSKPIRSVMMKLLPKGEIFSEPSTPLENFIDAITKELDRVKDFMDCLFSETPMKLNEKFEGSHLKGYLTDWEVFTDPVFDHEDSTQCEHERLKSIISALSSSGGQSPEYLSYVASRASGQKIIATSSSIPLTISVIGLKIKQTSVFTCTANANEKLTQYQRDENTIKTIERIKHAHLDSRYYDKDKTIYAQN